MSDPKAIVRLRQVGQWARAHGKPRPSSEEGWKVLLAEFVAANRQQHVVGGASWEEIPDTKATHMTWNGATTDIVDAQHGEPDEFHQMLADRDKALIEAGGDEFEQLAILRERRGAELNAFQPFTNVNPRSAVDAILGNNAIVVCGGPLSQVIYWQAGSDAETTNLNIALQPVNQPPPNVIGAIFRPFARVKWGTRSTQFTADIDIARGTQISLNAASVTVQVGLAADVSGNAPNDTTMNISGSLSFGGGGRFAPVTRTVWLDSPTGSETFLTVPSFAKRVSVITRTSAIATARQLNLKDSIGNSSSVQIAANSQLTVPIDIWDDVVVVSQTTAAGVDVGPCAFIFELAF